MWKEIPKYEGLYEVSDTGLIRTLEREWQSGKDFNITRTVKPEAETRKKMRDAHIRRKYALQPV